MKPKLSERIKSDSRVIKKDASRGSGVENYSKQMDLREIQTLTPERNKGVITNFSIPEKSHNQLFTSI